jgi:hypothetical protein
MKAVFDGVINLFLLIALAAFVAAIWAVGRLYLPGARPPDPFSDVAAYQMGAYLGIVSIAAGVLAFGMHGMIRGADKDVSD